MGLYCPRWAVGVRDLWRPTVSLKERGVSKKRKFLLPGVIKRVERKDMDACRGRSTATGGCGENERSFSNDTLSGTAGLITLSRGQRRLLQMHPNSRGAVDGRKERGRETHCRKRVFSFFSRSRRVQSLLNVQVDRGFRKKKKNSRPSLRTPQNVLGHGNS